MNELALFAGAGGGILGGKLLGWRTVCAVEWDAYAASVLIARQNDGILPPFPIWDDVQTFDGNPWRGRVDVVSGGFPCQDISAAGKGAGIDGKRSGMWAHMARVIGEVRPQLAFVENSPMLTSRGLGRVLGDLAALGYNAKWCVLGAIDAGAPHLRERIWIVAYSMRLGHYRQAAADAAASYEERNNSTHRSLGGSVADQAITIREDVPNPEGQRAGTVSARSRNQGIGATDPYRLHKGLPADSGQRTADSGQRTADSGQRTIQLADANSKYEQNVKQGQSDKEIWQKPATGSTGSRSNEVGWWASEPDVGRVANGVAARVDRLKAIGNGQVPAVVRLAWETLKP